MLTNQEIEEKLRALVREERRVLAEILELVREADRRRLWAERGFASAFEWLVKGLGYSEGAAHRRISAARLTRELPELEAKVAGGAITLSALASLHTTFRREEKRNGAKLPLETKREIARQVEGKSKAATEAVLATAFPESSPSRETLRAKSANEVYLQVTLSSAGRADLERARDLLLAALPGASWAAVIERLAREFVERKDPLLKLARKEPETENAPDRHRRNPAAVKRRVVLQRAQGRCEFVDRATGRRCEARADLQMDHIQPWALGGGSEVGNLRCLCGAHNRLLARKTFGEGAGVSLGSERERKGALF